MGPLLGRLLIFPLLLLGLAWLHRLHYYGFPADKELIKQGQISEQSQPVRDGHLRWFYQAVDAQVFLSDSEGQLIVFHCPARGQHGKVRPAGEEAVTYDDHMLIM